MAERRTTLDHVIEFSEKFRKISTSNESVLSNIQKFCNLQNAQADFLSIDTKVSSILIVINTTFDRSEYEIQNFSSLRERNQKNALTAIRSLRKPFALKSLHESFQAAGRDQIQQQCEFLRQTSDFFATSGITNSTSEYKEEKQNLREILERIQNDDSIPPIVKYQVKDYIDHVIFILENINYFGVDGSSEAASTLTGAAFQINIDGDNDKTKNIWKSIGQTAMKILRGAEYCDRAFRLYQVSDNSGAVDLLTGGGE